MSEGPFGKLPAYEDWLPEATAKYIECRDLLRIPLSDNSVVLQKQLRAAEAWQGTMGSMLAEAKSYLEIREHEVGSFAYDGETALDRKRRIAASVEQERRIHDYIELQVSSIKNRLILGENLNRSNHFERNKNAT